MSGTPNASWDLAEKSVAATLFELLRTRFTGSAKVESGRGPLEIFFSGGLPYHVRGEHDGQRLGELLIANGDLRAGQVADALAHAEQKGLRLGDALVELELATAEQVASQVHRQTLLRLRSCFVPAQGRVALFEPPPVELEASDVDAADGEAADTDSAPETVATTPSSAWPVVEDYRAVNSLAVILDGISEHYSAQRCAVALGSALGARLKFAPAFESYRQQFGFTDADAAALGVLRDGTVEMIAEVPGVSIARGLAIAAALFHCGMLEFSRVEPDAATLSLAQNLHRALQEGAKPHELLDVSADAEEAEVDRAWLHVVTRLMRNPETLGVAQLVNQAAESLAERRATLARYEAERLMDEGGYEAALPILTRALVRTPNDGNLMARAAYCRFQLSERRGADATRVLGDLELAGKVDGESALSPYYRGMVLNARGQEKLAIAAFEQATAIDPEFVEALRSSRSLRLSRDELHDDDEQVGKAPPKKKSKRARELAAERAARMERQKPIFERWSNRLPNHELFSAKMLKLYAGFVILLVTLTVTNIVAGSDW